MIITEHRPSSQALYWLLLSLTLTFGLHALNLNYWVPAAFIMLGGWRYLIERYQWPLPKLWLRLPLTIAGPLTVLWAYGSLFGRDASVSLLGMMVALKLLETRSQRDFIVMIVLGYFFSINVLLFSQTLWISLLLLLPLAGLTACLIAVSHPGALPWRVQAKTAGNLLLQAVPVMLVLFLLFPRIPGPIWGIPHDAYRGMTGLSDSLEFGSISELSLSSKVAFRVQFKSDIPPNELLYWRGPVLWHQEGRNWRITSPNLPLPQEALEVSGKPIDYTITLEPHNRNWLLLLDMPTALPPNTIIKHDMQAMTREPVRTRVRYDVQSHAQYRLAPTLSDRERTMALQLMEDENPKTEALGAEWQQTYRKPEDIVQAALTLFSKQNFVYTLAPPRLNEAPIDAFLFNTRRGFCEHYATSFVYLMRAAGVPARIVTGYQGGELNANGNYLIVRQSDAHAWAEVWLEGKGWVRIDPTAAVSPERIEFGIAGSVEDAAQLPWTARQDFPAIKKLYLGWDAINNGWNQWVLGYDEKKQLQLLTKIFGNRISWGDIGLIFMGGIILLMLLMSYLLLRQKAVVLDPVQRAYQQFTRKLSKVGIQKLPHEGAIDFGQRAAALLPHHAAEIHEISQLYSSLQYARHEKAGAKPQDSLYLLNHLVKRFKPTQHS